VAERLGWRFAKLCAASTTSALGSGLATIAAPLFVASRTSNPVLVSATFGVSWLPWLLFALPGGVLVDRADRRQLMIVIDSARVLAMGALAAAIATGHGSVVGLDIVLFIVNAGEVVFRSASQAMIPAVVARGRLERANGWLIGGDTLMEGMVAGPLAGFLFLVAASLPFFVNAGTYAVSAVLIALVAGVYRASPRPRAAPGSSPGRGGARRPRSARAEVAEGFRWLARQRLLRTMAVLIGLLNLTLTAAEGVLVLLARGPTAPRLGRLRPAVHVHGGGRHRRIGDRRPADQAGHRDLDDPGRPAGRSGDAPHPGHLAQRVRRRVHAVRLRGARRAVEHRRQFPAAAAHAARHARPGREHDLVHRGRRQLRRRPARRGHRGQVRA
jgi:MFS family permease